MKKGILVFLALAFSLAIVLPAFAEGPSQEAKSVTKPAIKTELVRLKYYRGMTMLGLINAYLSRDGHVSPGPDEKILVISDYTENIEKALQAIRQIDVKPPDLLFTVQLILGSETGGEGDEAIQNDSVIKELRSLLRYKSYSLLDTSMIRSMDMASSEVRMGKKSDFELTIRPKVVRDEKTALIQMEIRLRQFLKPENTPGMTMVPPAKIEYTVNDLISSTLNIKSGDKTVVGVSKLDGGDKGLILIISGKIVD